jgi:uncharacterized membrane protein YfcA
VAGLAGQWSHGIKLEPAMLSFVAIAFFGGMVGAWLGSLKFNQQILKYTLAVVLLLASVKLILT